MSSARTIAPSFRAICSTPSAPSHHRPWLITAAPSLDRRLARRHTSSQRYSTSSHGIGQSQGESSAKASGGSTASHGDEVQESQQRYQNDALSGDDVGNRDSESFKIWAGSREDVEPESAPQSGASRHSLDSLFGGSGDFHNPFTGNAGSQDESGSAQFTTSSSDSASSSRSPYASLFDDPDPFAKAVPKRDGSLGGFHMGGLSKRSVAEGAMGRNQWSGRKSVGRDGEHSRLSAQERKQWIKVLGNIADPFSDGKMGRFASRNDLVDPQAYRAKKKTLGGGSNANRLAALREGLSTEISEHAMEQGVDAAKQEMNAKVHEADLWEWAIKNVWGFDELALRQAANDLLTEGKEVSPTSTWVSKAQFGVGTPFYAPVLHRLLVHFRDRLKAPNSALSVLRITRALGSQSYVLGCTPELYSEALTTMYFWMHDLRGCLILLQEARDLGVLGDALGEKGGYKKGTTYHTTSLPGIVQTIQNDVSNKTLGVRAELQSKKVQKGANTEGDYLSELNSLFDQDEMMQDTSSGSSHPIADTATEQNQITLESLSLPALDALRIVEEMNKILTNANRPEEDTADDDGFIFDERPRSAKQQEEWHRSRRYVHPPKFEFPRRNKNEWPTKLGSKAYLRPTSRSDLESR